MFNCLTENLLDVIFNNITLLKAQNTSILRSSLTNKWTVYLFKKRCFVGSKNTVMESINEGYVD